MLDGQINGESVLAPVERGFAPTLKPSDIVVMDNLGSHKNKAARRAIRAGGATLLFVAKYSPNFNPIEPLFAKLRHWLRNTAERTRDALCRSLAQILDTFSATEFVNDLVNSGYART